MKRTKEIGILAILTATLCCQAAIAVNLDQEYLKSISRYYDSPLDRVEDMAEMGIAIEAIPVVFHIAGRAKIPVEEIVKVRMRGDSWMQISNKYSLDASVFYLIVSSKVESKSYAPIFEKFSNTPKNKWMDITLTDAEIINLVNLKMIYSLHDYSVYEIMAMRDYGKSFSRINHQVCLARAEMEKKKVLEAR